MPPRKAQAVVAEEVAVADKPATRSKTKKGADAATSGHVPFNVMSYIYEDLDEIEKKANLVSHGFGRNCARLSTGLVSLDMFLDGGLIPGGWYTVAGPEQSAKSTLTMTLVAACVKQNFNGVGAVFDYEGSSDEDYIMNMCKNLGIKNVDRAKIFGTQDPQTGQYIVNGMFRYYDPDVGEKFFQYMSMLRRRLPDKVVNEKGEAFYIFDHTVKNKKKLAGQYDAEYLRRQNKLRVPAENTSMQSLTVVDSYPAMLPDQMDDDDPSGAMALQARMFSDGIKKFRGGMRRKMMTILGVNQLRERPAQQHGDPNYEPCGNALKFYCVHPSTIVEYLDPHGNVAQMTAREYLDQYGPADMDERPPIRVPTAEGWAVPNEVFPTDGGKYAGKPTLVVKTATGETLYGSSGHSILTSTVTNVSHPWDDTPTWSDKSDDDLHDFGLRGMAAAPATVRRGRSFRDVRITAPRVGWSRLTNLGRAALKNVFTFVESRDRDPRQTDAMWMQYLVASVPEYADIHRSLHDQAAVQSPDHANIVDVLAAFNMLNPEQVMESFKLSADEYDVVYAQYAYIEELVTLYLDLSPENVLAPVKIAAVQRAAPINQTDDYVDFSVGGSWVSSGIVSHNSDVRIRVMPRAIPDAFKNLPAERGVISEPSVEFGTGRVDRYKFISGRTIKNKLGGIPNQEFWARVWEADGKGNARGFDPVYDTYYYLKQLNLLGGQRNKIKFAAPTPLAGARRAITWQELKLLILGTTAEIKELCAELDVKPVSLRSWVFKFARSDEGRQLVRDSIVAKTSAAAEDDE